MTDPGQLVAVGREADGMNPSASLQKSTRSEVERVWARAQKLKTILALLSAKVEPWP